MTSLLITNANVVNEGTTRQLDVLVQDGRIAQVGADLSGLSADRLMDASGLHLLPGMIDDQVHFREPGLTHKGEIATESAAAVAGGITSYFEMPNVNPLTINRAALEDKYERASQKSLANYAFYLGASNDNLDEIKNLDPKAACGIKVFMGASTGNMLVDKPEILEGIFAHAPTIVVTHCEDTPMIKANEDKYREQYGEDVPMSCHPLIRSEEACYKSSSYAVSLAKRFGTRLHVLHLTTEKELALFEAGDLANKQITAEACVHHLFFSEEDYETKGSLIKCNPAVKKASDREALLNAVRDDLIDVVATDHAPHTWEEKQNSYFKAPAGLPLVQHALVSMLEHYHAGRFSLEHIVKKVCHNVAELFQISERGYIREGYWADLVLVDLNRPTVVDEQTLYSKCGWSPFAGYIFKSSIQATLVNGEVAFENGAVNPHIRGKRLAFNR
ncbi:dihydroorotase [Ketobacter sp.]|uniref:dihydroorotase n=1 Tax=Ketobacter sp. TaxID=2083498 RepID=UPI000F1FC1BD|nr:dihydroorotase [Ketobacter sp.]RLT93234.1 MAG: dihydroorotase [Ketobacter sp.]